MVNHIKRFEFSKSHLLRKKYFCARKNISLKKILHKNNFLTKKRDATLQSFGVNATARVECSYMSDPVMPNVSSPDASSSSSSLIVYTIVAIGLALFIRFFIAAPYIVSGASMEPTFYDYHYLIIDRVTYRLHEPSRGDVIVLDLPQNTSRALIKRIIGLPGETITIDQNKITIVNEEHPEGFTLEESYLDPENIGGASGLQVRLEKDQFFVLGDNRRVSADSRIWGTLPREDIEGRVFLRLYPFTQIGILPGAEKFEY